MFTFLILSNARFSGNNYSYANLLIYLFIELIGLFHSVSYIIFSFGMLLWELVFEKIPYEKWNIMQIKEHVLAGNREKITWGKASPDVEKLQKGLAKIIVSGKLFYCRYYLFCLKIKII